MAGATLDTIIANAIALRGQLADVIVGLDALVVDARALKAATLPVDPPPVIVDPPPVPVPAPTALAVHPLKRLSDCEFIDKATRVKWRQVLGDWKDADGVLNGPKPTRSGSGTTATIPLAGFGDVMIQNARITQVVIDGVDVTAACYWTSPDSNSAQNLPNANSGPPNYIARPVIIPQSGGATMVLTFLAASAWRMDAVAEPSVPAIAYIGGFRAPDIFDVKCTSRDAIIHSIAGTQVAGGDPEYVLGGDVQFATTAGGLPYIRMGNSPQGSAQPFHPRLINWLFPLPNLDEVYTGQAIYIEADAWDSMRELGVKLSGPGGGGGPLDPMGFHLIGEHSASANVGAFPWPKNPANRGIFGVDYYVRDVTTGGSNPRGGKNGAFGLMRSGGWYWHEQRMRLNTVGKADGIAQMWLNGALICDELIEWRKDGASRIKTLQEQIYHGGLGTWSGPAHYRLGMIRASTQYIGVPPEMRATP